MKRECPRCEGDGYVAFNLSPRVPVDPRLEVDAVCPVCHGLGEIGK